MRVSCICPTYNRVEKRQHLLEEAIESFLRQDYADKELLVVNDHASQTLVGGYPNVRIINLSERFPTLGAKYNYAIRQATGNLICSWEDDDISLPNRISDAVAKIGTFDYFNPRRYWFLDGDGLHHEHPMGYAHNCSMFTREAFEKVGGYAELSGPQDADMDGKLRRLCAVAPVEYISPREWTFIYRWGVSNLHLSAYSNTQQVYDNYANQAKADGTFILKPHWATDYLAMTQQHLEKHGL